MKKDIIPRGSQKTRAFKIDDIVPDSALRSDPTRTMESKVTAAYLI